MPRDERRLRPSLVQPEAPQRNRGRQNSRLRLVGLIQLVFRALLGQRPEVIAQRGRSLGEGISNDSLLRAQLCEHAQGLRALPWKDESE